jgi:rhamnose utilization protein RhaD (predicted bifunctional aldolase and dehydrogenase)
MIEAGALTFSYSVHDESKCCQELHNVKISEYKQQSQEDFERSRERRKQRIENEGPNVFIRRGMFTDTLLHRVVEDLSQ